MSSSTEGEPQSPAPIRWELAEELAGSAGRPTRDFLEILLSRLSVLMAVASQNRLIDPSDPRAPQADVDAAFVVTAILDVLRAYDMTLTERNET